MKILFRSFMAIGSFLVFTCIVEAQEPASTETRTSFISRLRLFDEADAESAAGERRDEIETDRDSFTPATTTAGKGRLIFESAWTYFDNRGYKETNSFPEAILRYGLTERLEFRFGANYEVGGVPGEFTSSELERDSNIAYGLKYRLTESENWLPGSAFIVQASTPTSGRTTVTQLTSTYVFGWELPSRIKLDAAFRYIAACEESDHFNEWAPSVVLKVPLGEIITVHAEYFGLFSTNKAEAINHQYISPGAHFLVTEDLEIGFRLGWGLNDQTPRFFSNVGIGLRF